MRRLPPRLLALSPGDLAPADVERFLVRAARAIAAGLSGVLLREPALSDRVVLELALALRARLGPGGWLAVHDRVHLAVAAGADAVQLGFRSLTPADARAVLPEHVAIGFSAHADDPIEPWCASDFLLLGPVFDTPSKAGVKAPLGLDGLAREVARAPRPVWALGGITAERARAVIDAGATGVAVRGALLGGDNPVMAVQSFLATLSL
ncbi:MAG: thiamine phosphate synthase [Planctomycetes bacterium]|nr:thiamine phosphate synthase [Planctomycetota bacterium]